MSFIRLSITVGVATLLSASSSLFVNAAAAAPSSAQIAEIVYWHNAARAQIAQSGNCANMLYADWDTSVATAAQSNVCPTTHNGAAASAFGSYIGEDLAWASGSCTTGLCSLAGNCGGTGQPACESGCGTMTSAASAYCTIKSMVYDSWYQSESTNPYTTSNNCKSYNGGGGHCSQVNWQSSVGIGCAYQTGCPSWTYTLNCNYNPAGNFNIPDANTVYLACTSGTACSACPSDYPNCISSGVFQGLCTKTASTSTTAAPSTTTTTVVATTAAATTATAVTTKATTAAAVTAKATTAAAVTAKATTAAAITAKATTAASTATTAKPTSTTSTTSSSTTTTTTTPTTSTPTTTHTIILVLTFSGSYPVTNTAWQKAFLNLVDDITGTTDSVSISSATSNNNQCSITLSIIDSASTGLTAEEVAAMIRASCSSSTSSSSSSTTSTQSLSSAYPGVIASDGSTSSDSSSSSSLSTTIIAIIAAVGGVVVLVFVAASVWWCLKRRQNTETANTTNRLGVQLPQI